MATVSNYNTGAIEDAMVTAFKTDLATVTDSNGKTLQAIVSSTEMTWEDFVADASKGDGGILVWLKRRASQDKPSCLGQVFEKRVPFRLRVMFHLSGGQEGTNAQNKAYLYKLMSQVVTTVATNKTWSGNAIDSFVSDEQEISASKHGLIGFEMTITPWFWYYIN